MTFIIDLTGKKFGRLTVLKFLSRKNKGTWWKCECICGKTTIVSSSNLQSGSTNSCGCLRIELGKLSLTTHGKTKTREFASWQHMLDRCYNPKSDRYKDYGGRGVKVCDRWLGSFEAFLEDVGPRPKGKTLDRYPDKHGDYEKSNCRWATPPQQARNRGNNRNITYKGKIACLTEWAEILGITCSTLRRRLDTLKWPVEKAFETPVKSYNYENRRIPYLNISSSDPKI